MEKTDEGFNFELILEEYKSLQAETHLRIGENHKLLFFKMASCGALFSFSILNPAYIFGSLLAPLIAVMVDFLIINNLCLIGAMGHYVSTVIERRYFAEGWDTITGKTQFYGAKPVTWLNDWLVMIGSTSVTYIVTAILLLKYAADKEQSLVRDWRVCGIITFATLFLWDVLYSIRILNIYSEVKSRIVNRKR